MDTRAQHIGTPRISIVVPVYNPGDYFPPCLASLEAQSIFPQLEVVLVDDGSSDGSEALCDEFAARHPGQVQVIHQTNHGLGYTRNAGIEAATGDWVLFVDSDDAITPDACEQLLAAGETSGQKRKRPTRGAPGARVPSGFGCRLRA